MQSSRPHRPIAGDRRGRDTDPLLSIVTGVGLRALYQPIVELDGGGVVGYEALARGPIGSALEAPDALFGAAREAGLLAQLDWACRTVAVRGAVEARLAPPLSLFVNSEPEVAGSLMPSAFAQSWAAARRNHLQLIFELTERAIVGRPAELLRNVRYLKSLGWGIALDDVGAHAGSLALLPFIRPDVIKLDMRAVQAWDREIIQAVMAANAEAERSGALILAEGIETEEHLERAKTLGARVGQGWLFGRPAPLPADIPVTGAPIQVRGSTSPAEEATPFERLSRDVPSRRVAERDLRAFLTILEERAAGLPYPPVLVAAFPSADRFMPHASRYAELAGRSPFVALLGDSMPAEPAAGVKGVALHPDDPMVAEWLVCVVSPYTGFVCAAREASEAPGQYDFVVSFDRDRAVEACSVALDRVVAPAAAGIQEGLVDFASVMEQVAAEEASVGERVRPLLDAMAQLTGLESTFLSSVTDGEYETRFAVNLGTLSVAEGTRLPWVQSICKRAIEIRRPLFADVQRELADVSVGRDFGFRRYVTLPIALDDGRVTGTLCGASAEAGPFTDEELAIVQTFAELIRDAIAD